ncbi:MAG: hypothetical protein WCO98_07215 [bacterium]
MTENKWDPSQPIFLNAISKVLILLAIVVVSAGIIWFKPNLSGLISGSILALALYFTAVAAGRTAVLTKKYFPVMLGLLGQQFILWVGTGIAIIGLKVDPLGVIISVSILPGSIIVALIWFNIRRKFAK